MYLLRVNSNLKTDFKFVFLAIENLGFVYSTFFSILQNQDKSSKEVYMQNLHINFTYMTVYIGIENYFELLS